MVLLESPEKVDLALREMLDDIDRRMRILKRKSRDK